MADPPSNLSNTAEVILVQTRSDRDFKIGPAPPKGKAANRRGVRRLTDLFNSPGSVGYSLPHHQGKEPFCYSDPVQDSGAPDADQMHDDVGRK